MESVIVTVKLTLLESLSVIIIVAEPLPIPLTITLVSSILAVATEILSDVTVYGLVPPLIGILIDSPVDIVYESWGISSSSVSSGSSSSSSGSSPPDETLLKIYNVKVDWIPSGVVVCSRVKFKCYIIAQIRHV